MKTPKPSEIRAKRLSYDLTQNQASALIGQSYASWSRWERGLVMMNVSKWKHFIFAAENMAADKEDLPIVDEFLVNLKKKSLED